MMPYSMNSLRESIGISFNSDLHAILLPDATPRIVYEHISDSEHRVLALLNYNRILDMFLGLTCYHLQSHWFLSARKRDQMEICDFYIGIDVDCTRHIVPIQVQGKKDRISKTQIVQNVGFARERYPKLIIRPLGIQEINDKDIVVIEFTAGKSPDAIKIKEMRRYKLVPMSECPVNEK